VRRRDFLAGAAGALAGTLVYAIICVALIPQLKSGVAGGTWAAYLAAAAGLCVASILGDLFESAAKRQAAYQPERCQAQVTDD